MFYNHRSNNLLGLLYAAAVILCITPPLNAFSPPSPFIITASSPSSPLKSSSQSDLSANLEELELLRKERRIQRRETDSEQNEEEKNTPTTPIQHQLKETRQPKNSKKSIKTILSIPVGDLTQSDLVGLCNSIRYVPEEKALWSLRILERILIEVERWEDAQRFDKKTFVKKIHVFSVLTALSKSSQRRKAQKRRYSSKKNKYGGKQLQLKDMERLKNVVFLLKELCRNKRSPYCDADCYHKDVLTFAIMIAADSSSVEESAVEACLMFIDEIENETNAWDARVIGSVLNALAHWGRVEEANELLSRAMGFHITTDASQSSSDFTIGSKMECLDPIDATQCYDSLLRAYAKHAFHLHHHRGRRKKYSRNVSAKEALTCARHILLNHMPEKNIQISNHSCNAVLSGYSSLGMGTEAERLLTEIETQLSDTLDIACYNSVLHGYSRERNSIKSAERLYRAVKEQRSLHKGMTTSKMLPPKPDIITYSSMLSCYSKNKMGDEAYALMTDVESPTTALYLSAIQALEKSNDPSASDKVVSLVGLLEMNRKRSTQDTKSSLNIRVFNAAMKCMIKRGEGSKAEEILNKYLESSPSRKENDIQPYLLALKAYEKTKPMSHRKDAANKAEQLVRKMQSLEHMQNLDEDTYSILLNCFARAGMVSEAEKLLSELESNGSKLSPESHALVIKAIALSDDKDAVERAWSVLHQLGYPQKHVKDVEPFNISITAFNSMLKLFARRGMAKEAEALLYSIDNFILEGKSLGRGPNLRSYEAVVEALGKSGDSDAVERAEALVTRVEVMSELGGGIQQPSLKLYNTLLNIYANAGKVGSAERLLSRLNDESHKPDIFSYGATIKALKNSGKSKEIAITRAKELSQSLERNGGVGNEIIFAHRLSILAKFGLAQKAENLLQEMKEKHELGYLKQGPGVIHYTAVLNAWSKSDDKKAVARAEALFEKIKMDPLLDLDLAAYHGLLLNYAVRGMSKKARRLLQVILDSDSISPNRNTFTMVIDSYSRGSSNAGVKAEELLDQMRELHAAGNPDVEPDGVSYASVIRAKQASETTNVRDLTEFDKLNLMRDLQIETWPFQ